MARRGRRRRSRTRRRSVFRRRRRGRRRSIRSRLRGHKSGFTGLKSAIGGIVFLSQLTQKDRDAGAYNVGSMGDKAKILANNVFGRVVGINPFSDVQSFPQTINIDGAFNKYTGAGLAGFIYSKLPIKGLPHKGKAGSLGKAVAVAGFLGGIFDAPENRGASPRVVAQNPSSSRRAFITNGRQVTTT